MRKEDENLFNRIRSKFATFPGEEIILVQRKHWSTFLFPVVILFVLQILAFILLLVISSIIPETISILILVFFFLLALITTIMLQSLVDWHFNVYVVTNKKISEVSYKPLSSRAINEVMLDQVRCTEIDTRTDGFINEFFDIGDVIITFDRPTHQEEFYISNVHNPKKIENRLQRTLVPMSNSINNSGSFIYARQKDNPKRWRYMEEIVDPQRGGEKVWNI